ncbi:hypothetical protein NPIL_375151 [Nephila pilipes]|uniref:Uncharacterized protein n=1 Tax=Nephila pilipes TaxID=299642 RepID=A0A8X6NVE7_NEPPI|nr:hypothetical protein NPIL_375151 [Nephila pilipes]
MQWRSVKHGTYHVVCDVTAALINRWHISQPKPSENTLCQHTMALSKHCSLAANGWQQYNNIQLINYVMINGYGNNTAAATSSQWQSWEARS